jgi:hypothetical protein
MDDETILKQDEVADLNVDRVPYHPILTFLTIHRILNLESMKGTRTRGDEMSYVLPVTLTARVNKRHELASGLVNLD